MEAYRRRKINTGCINNGAKIMITNSFEKKMKLLPCIKFTNYAIVKVKKNELKQFYYQISCNFVQ